jgi:hypothetical protein
MLYWEIPLVALFLAACHFTSPYVFEALEKYRKDVASFAAGLAISYVFLHLIPELEQSLGTEFTECAVQSTLIIFSFFTLPGKSEAPRSFVANGLQ